MTIGQRIQELRKKRNITQKQLSEMIGKGFSTVQKYEIDAIQPPLDVLQKIADALEISLPELYGANENPMARFNFMTDLLSFDPDHSELISYYDQLNNSGKETAIQRVKELTEIERYTRPDEEPPQK